MEDDFEVLEHCDIDCQNGGLCRQGDASFPILGPTKEPLQIFATRNLNGFHCQCRPGYTGVDCSIKYETCFDQQSGIVAQCFHGGRCRSLDQVDYEHYNLCDCEPAGEDSGDRYTGKYCEIKATFDSFCEGNDGFCLNGGVCSGSGDGAAGCNCTDAFWGDHCEEVFDDRPTECTLECRNGGECRIEARDMIDELTDHLYDVLNLDQMYCECPPGFGGLLCQYEVDVCGDYKKICLHGSRCVSDVEDQSGFRCECSNPSCALEMELCNPSDGVVEYSAGMAVPAYCFNGGKCKDLVVNGLV